MSLVEKPKPASVNSFEAMKIVIETLKGQQAGNAQHMATEIKQPGTDIGYPISWWFDQHAKDFMQSLIYDKNNLIVPQIRITAFS